MRYASFRFYRIWNPCLNKVVITRDIIFDERQIYDDELIDMRNGLNEPERETLCKFLDELWRILKSTGVKSLRIRADAR